MPSHRVAMVNQAFPNHWELQLTSDDIKHGHKGSCRCCPIAQAFMRELNRLGVRFDYIEVMYNSVTVWKFIASNEVIARYVPNTIIERRRARAFIDRFDDGKLVQPVTIAYRRVRPDEFIP